MAQVLNIFYLAEGITGDIDAESGQITQNETAIVIFSEPVRTVKQAIADGPFKPGMQHRFDRTMQLDGNIKPSKTANDNGTSWTFELVWKTLTLGSTTARDDVNYRPVVKPGRWTYTRVVDRDKETGEAFLNPAGDPIDPLPIETISSPLLKITLKEYSANMQRLNLVGSVNNAGIRIAGVDCPKYCVMLDDYIPEPYTDDKDILTFNNTFVIKLKFFKNKDDQEIGFKLELLNQGFNFLDAGTKKEFQVEDADGNMQPVATPQLLDENGEPTDTPTYTERLPFDLADFSQFGLPNNYPIY